MVDFSRLKEKKRKTRFGKIPSQENQINNLESSETAPSASGKNIKKARRKTGRTIQFSTRVSTDFDDEFRLLAFKKKLKKAELLEKCLEAYKQINKQ